MTPGRVVAAIFGVIFAPAAIGLLVGGIAIIVLFATGRDSAGYLTSPTYEMQTDSYALTSDRIDLAPQSGTWWPNDLVTARFNITSPDGTPVFLGIGPTDEVNDYLGDVARARIDRLGYRIDRVTYREIDGDAPSAAPASLDFWELSATTSDNQTVTWDVKPGTWSVVIMNADASAGIAVEAAFGVAVDLLLWIGIGMTIVGVILGALSAGLLVFAFGSGGRAGAVTPATAAPMSGRTARETVYPVLLEGQLDEPLSRWMWLIKWFLAIPHFIILGLLWVAFVFVSILAFFSILFTGRYPRGLFDFNVGVLRWWWRVIYYCTSVLGTDRYPPFSLADADYPAKFDVAYPERLSQGLVLVKWWLLAIPHYIIVGLLTSGLVWWTTDIGGGGDRVLEIGGGLLGILTLIAALILLFSGSYSRSMFDLLMGLNRWVFRVIAYAALMRDEYPPFRLDLGGTEPPAAAPPAAASSGAESPPTGPS